MRQKANFKPQTEFNTSLYRLYSSLTTFKLIVVHFCCNAERFLHKNTFTSLLLHSRNDEEEGLNYSQKEMAHFQMKDVESVLVYASKNTDSCAQTGHKVGNESRV